MGKFQDVEIEIEYAFKVSSVIKAKYISRVLLFLRNLPLIDLELI